MNNLQNSIFSVQQIRACEQLMKTHAAVSEEEMMLRAGRGAFTFLQNKFPKLRKIVVFCGSGNNAGDGYVVARLAHEAGYSVTINQFRRHDDLPPVAKTMAYAASAAGVPCQWMDESVDPDVEIIIDALLGTGLNQHVREPLLSAISLINSSELPVLSLDVPSGLHADTGQILGDCVRASATITFIGAKTGLYTLNGPDYCGEIAVETLHSESCLAQIKAKAQRIDGFNMAFPEVRRLRNSHKGDFGHVLIIGGSKGMPGSVRLAAHAALRTGAGLVTIATLPDYAHAIPELPEAMIYGINDTEELAPLVKKASVCIIGPGLGLDNRAQLLFDYVLASHIPMVIDASALHLLAANPQHDDNWILTPHPGEAAALLATNIDMVQQDRFLAVGQLQQRYGGCIVLKGCGTLVADGQSLSICTAGNPGMASAGMGDTLSGIIAALVAQKLSLAEAAALGVWLHATAADLAAMEDGERGLLAGDLLLFVRLLVNKKIRPIRINNENH